MKVTFCEGQGRLRVTEGFPGLMPFECIKHSMHKKNQNTDFAEDLEVMVFKIVTAVLKPKETMVDI